MADTPNQPPTTPVSEPETPNRNNNDNNSQYWCYHCNKRVAVEPRANSLDTICRECKRGFVELIPAIAVDYDHNEIDESVGNRFLQLLHLLAQSTHDDAPVPPRSPAREDEENLTRELAAFDDEDDDDDDDDDEEEEEEDEEEEEGEDDDDEEEVEDGEDENENDNEENRGYTDIEDEEEELRRRRDVLRLRIRELATRARSGRRDRVLGWAELWMGIEDNSMYVGNPGDYVDEAEYDAVLRELAESDTGGRKGAPPAAKSVVSELPKEKVVAEEGAVECAVCKDGVEVGEFVTKLPCGHVYHGECIVPWLGFRNTCPVCRFELPTDDADYEEQRKKRVVESSGGV